MKKLSDSCYCGAQNTFSDCCGRFILGQDKAVTALQLMRSRYAAYVVHCESYLLATWHFSKRPASIRFDPNMHWFDLQIKHVQKGEKEDSAGVVEFIARYKVNGRAHRLHESSSFVKIDGAWFYVNGEIK